MDIQHTKDNHQDERGVIHDILTHDEVDAVTYITYDAPGVIRANHFHEKSVQWDYVITGRLECYGRQGYDGTVEMEIIGPGDLVKHPIGEHHALRSLEPSTTLSLTKGPRRGENYEDDVVRLSGDERLVS